MEEFPTLQIPYCGSGNLFQKNIEVTKIFHQVEKSSVYYNVNTDRYEPGWDMSAANSALLAT